MNYEAIRAAMQEELDNPLSLYMPNSPGAFVRDRLFRQCYWEEATWFWGAYCRGKFGIFELDELLPQLNALSKHEKMPDWGTSGTQTTKGQDMSKLTPWFPSAITPVYVGVYETSYHLYEDEWSDGFSFWDGNKWTNQGCSVASTYARRNWTEGAIQEKKWRGLAKEPK